MKILNGKGLKVDVCGVTNFTRYETERIPKI
jgi:hypothetical protein